MPRQNWRENISAGTFRICMACGWHVCGFSRSMVRGSGLIWRFINLRTASIAASQSSNTVTAQRGAITPTWTTSCKEVLGALKYRRTPFEIFNLGENQTTTLADLITAIESALGKKAVIERLPEQQGDMAADLRGHRESAGAAWLQSPGENLGRHSQIRGVVLE